ncbi:MULTISPECIES: DUF4913 domain-containing protein [unclassified Streptomyces]|uniref:DUF4913 domain-containing protein n=1 Tax=unclassified Streptomyces TaxID=2593676 RepID=UPI003253D6B6
MTTENPYDSYDADDVTRQEQQGALVFPTLEAFVTEYLAEILRDRDVTAVGTWCPSWWRHPEAIVRLNVLWRTFEYLRHDSTLGMSHWWLHHVDPHLAILLHPVTGPFRNCRSGHAGGTALPLDPVPAGEMDDPVYSVHTEDPFLPRSGGDRP